MYSNTKHVIWLRTRGIKQHTELYYMRMIVLPIYNIYIYENPINHTRRLAEA